MPKVKFTETVIHETEGYKKGPKFEEGKVYDLPEDQAERWLRRKLAVSAEKAKKVDEPEIAGEPVEEAEEVEEEEDEEEETETEGDAQPTMPRRRGRPPKVR